MKTQLGGRKISTREDGGFWSYGYNARSEVASASRFFSDQTAMPLEQFSYTYDGVGNRLTAASGGRRETHSVNSSNQVTSRTHNGRLTVTGEADPASNVVVEAQDARRAQRKGPLFWTELNLPLSTGGVYQPINIWSAKPNAGTGGADLIAKKTGVRFISPSPESLTYDADGNLTGDARWSYGWDAENWLIWMEEHVNPTLAGSGLQRQRLEFAYDALGRRVSKKVRAWNEPTSTWVFQRRIVMVWDGWTLLAELESATETGTLVTRRSYVWGLDLASSPTATGGVGALLFAREHNTSGTLVATYTPCYDGNGNVMALMNVQTSAITARYEYDAFGNLLRSTGPKASWNPFRFSTKYEDRESGLLYYGYRYYSPELGRWVNRDPIEEEGGINLYEMVGNDLVNLVDLLGQAICVTTKSGKFLFQLDDSQQILRTMTAQELYDNVKAQWFEPNADNYMPLIALAKDIGSFPELKHYSWDDIAKFALVDRYSLSFRPRGSGDWKHSVASGYLLVTVGGVPYWADAIGQIPFAVDTYRMHRVSPNVTSNENSILATLETGRKHADGSPLGTTNIPPKGHYDEYMVVRGAVWASSRFKEINPGSGLGGHKRLEETT